MATATTISLREWIKKCPVNCSKSSISISGSCCGRDDVSLDYLFASLKIALSLADDINNAEDLARIGFSDRLNMLPQQNSNGTIPDWAESIIVRLEGDQGGIGKEEQMAQETRSSIPIPPLPQSACKEPRPSSAPVIDGVEFPALLDGFVDIYGEGLGVLSTESGSNITDELVQNQVEQRYLNVDSASIEAIGKGSEDFDEIFCSDSVRDKQKRIYSLGLVFFELFSGGKRPPPELLVSPSSLVKPNNDAAKKLSPSHAFDFTTGLQLFDDSVVHDQCDYPIDLIKNNAVLGCEERLTGDQDENVHGFESRKRQATVHHSLRHLEHIQEKKGHEARLRKVTTREAVEQLKLKCLPESLCNMIYNMIDCINGDFSGDQSYSNLKDVTADLRLMVEHPEKFLRDLDVNALSLMPLTLNETIFANEDEFASLMCAYRRSASGSPQIVLIAGESGTGKSSLACRLGQFIVSNGGVFLQGKFDRLKQAQPLSVLATALNAYCHKLIHDTDRERAKLIGSKLQEALGRDACHLVKVIPTLGEVIVYDECNSDSDANQDCVYAQERLCYLIRRFVETISSCSDCIIALFLDDLQWTDDISISVVGEILKSSDANTQFFFLGCFREEELENGHPFWKMIESAQGLGVAASIVKLECMSMDTVTRVLSYLLCLSPRHVRSLSDIVYHKTKGNPLFFSQFILSLNKEGLLYLNLARRRWEWDEETIMSRGLPDDVAEFFTARIDKLEPEVKLALNILSCFGASIEVDVIKELEGILGDRLIDPLAVAEKEGFVTKTDTKYFFGHDRIQEAAYSTIPAEERCLHHMKYGLSLAELALNEKDNNRMLFIAVGQTNLGSPSAVSNDEQRLKVVKYNLAAGKAAVDMSDFHSAFNFFDNGITFLKKTHWRDHYDLSLELYELAAECALITGDVLSLTVLAEQVMKNACTFEDTLNISYICMSTLSYTSEISVSVEMGLEILSKLGEELPTTFPSDYIELQIQTTQAMLDELSVVDLLNYRLMTDEKKIMAMKLLSRLKVMVQQVNPNLIPILTLKMVEITIKYGMSPTSPIGFAYFGSIIAKLGNIQGGYKFTSLAISLVDKLKLRDIAGQVFSTSNHVLCFIAPLRIANENQKENEAIALAAGDVACACYSRVFYVTNVFWSGSKLSVAAEAVTQGRRFVMSRGHVTSDNYLLLMQQSILKLIGTPESEIIADDVSKQRVLDSNNPLTLEIHYFQKLFASFVLDEYCSMKESATEYFKCSATSWMVHSNHIFRVLIVALVSFRIYRETKVSFWLDRGTKFKSQLQLWAEQGSPWTFENKCDLLEAEEHFSHNRLDFARAAYERAISSAKVHKVSYEEALAYELAATFYYNMCDFSASLEYYTAAHDKYCEWGAYAKANSLYTSIQEKFMASLGAPSAHLISFTDEFNRQQFDVKETNEKENNIRYLSYAVYGAILKNSFSSFSLVLKSSLLENYRS